MDPEATLRNLLSAVEAGDIDQVDELSEALLQWIDGIGDPPKIIGRWKLGLIWHIAVTHSICELAKAHVRRIQAVKERDRDVSS